MRSRTTQSEQPCPLFECLSSMRRTSTTCSLPKRRPRALAASGPLSEPKVSIVIVNWNTYEITRECLLSLRALTYKGASIVLVDNASSDDSAARLSTEFEETIVISNSENLGFTGGCNVGIKHALKLGAQYILLLNSDTIVDSRFLSLMVHAAEKERNIGLLNPTILHSDSGDPWYAGGSVNLWTGIPRHNRGARGSGEQSQAPVDVTFVTGCALLIKAPVVRHIGLLDETFFLAYEDADWSIRARRAGYRAVYVPNARIWHKESYTFRSTNCKSRRDYYNARNALILASKHANFYQWPSLLTCYLSQLAYRACGYALLGQPARIKGLFLGLADGAKQLWSRRRGRRLALRNVSK